VSAVRFVGREGELALFESAVRARKPPFSVLQIHGAGGVGKSTLLRRFAEIAGRAGRAVIAIDGRDVPPSRREFIRAIESASGAKRIILPGRGVLLIDTYEALQALDTWLRETLLPQLPADAMVVIAGRAEPALPWRTDVAWAPMTRIVELGNFSTRESIAFLESRGMAGTAGENVLEFTRGHPLALSLVADVLAAGSAPFDPARSPNVVQHLLSLFVESLPAGRLGEALRICAISRVTNERLLVQLLGGEEGRLAFEWLRRQSFIEIGPRGLFPHDLVREVLLADAQWRDGEEFQKLWRRIYSALYRQVGDTAGRQRQHLQMDALYVTRTRPTNQTFFAWTALDDVRTEPAEPRDAEWIVDLVKRHEGQAAAALARDWLRLQPEAFHVFYDAHDARVGFLALLDLGAAASVADDPAIASAQRFLESHDPVERGAGIIYLRWWMHCEAYQAVTAAINLTAMHVVSRCVTQPGMAWNFVAMADPAFWDEHFRGVNFPRAAAADFEIDGRLYGVFAHDWRIEPPADWLMGPRVPMPFSSGATEARTVPLSAPDFERALRDALRNYTRAEVLDQSPLRFSRMMRDGERSGTAVQKMLREAVSALETNPRDAKLYRAVWFTYFEPLETQERVAERLDLSFSTYRHHLRRGIERIGRWLRYRERAG
jgi:hypothetical protein